jgi:hypothetical protein
MGLCGGFVNLGYTLKGLPLKIEIVGWLILTPQLGGKRLKRGLKLAQIDWGICGYFLAGVWACLNNVEGRKKNAGIKPALFKRCGGYTS